MQRPLRAEDCNVDVRVAAHAEDYLLASGLVHRAVADDPRISGEQIFVEVDDLAEVRRAGFFLTFENELDVHQGSDAVRLKRVECREDGHHSCFIV